MSPRNFARAFRGETGMTPAAYVEQLRVERARLLLESTPPRSRPSPPVRVRHRRDDAPGVRRGASA